MIFPHQILIGESGCEYRGIPGMEEVIPIPEKRSKTEDHFQGTHSYLMFTASNGCEVLVSPTFCNVLRIPPYWAIMCFGVIVNVMVIERLLATIKLKTYEDISSVLGVSLCAASVCQMF